MRFIEEILELENKGYFPNPPEGMLNYIRKSDEFKNIRKFKTSFTSGSKKYSCYDIFGTQTKYCLYKINRKEEFIAFIINEFEKINPNPEMGLRKAFARIMHDNYLNLR